jgi:hypothetical protein
MSAVATTRTTRVRADGRRAGRGPTPVRGRDPRRHRPGHACRTPAVRTVVVPEAADGQSAHHPGSVQLPLLCLRASPAGGLRPPSGPAATRRYRGTRLTLHLGGTNSRRTSRTTSEAGGRRRAAVALAPRRLDVLLRAIPAGRALVVEPVLGGPTTTPPPKPRPHRLELVQHARLLSAPTVLHARTTNKRSTKT